MVGIVKEINGQKKEELKAARQAVRDKINELQAQLQRAE